MKDSGINTVKSNLKNRLFILGDSWGTPYFEWYDEYLEKDKGWYWYKNIEKYILTKNARPLTFTSYLENHFKIVNLSCGGQSNESILYQLGSIDDFQKGDRIFIILSHACRFRINVVPQWVPDNYFRRREVDISPSYLPRYNKGTLKQMLIDREDSWHSGDRNDELGFYENLYKLLDKYKPVIYSWSEDFIKTKIKFFDYYGYRIVDEYPEYPDYHLGCYGNYLFYSMILNWLLPNTKPVDYNGNME